MISYRIIYDYSFFNSSSSSIYQIFRRIIAQEADETAIIRFGGKIQRFIPHVEAENFTRRSL